MQRPSPQLIASWYARLRATGFRDIEYGRDTNEIDGWTFRGAKGAAHVQMPDGFEPQFSLADHPTAVYFRGLEHAARELIGRRRRLMLITSMSDAGQASRKLGMSHRTARYQVQRFAAEIGLVRDAHGS